MTGRKILIDTNVFIGLEDQKEIAPEFAKMVHTLAHPCLMVPKGCSNAHGAGRGCPAWPSVGRRTVGRQPLDGENDDAHGHEEGARNLSLLGHQDEGEYDQYRTDDPLNPLV